MHLQFTDYTITVPAGKAARVAAVLMRAGCRFTHSKPHAWTATIEARCDCAQYRQDRIARAIARSRILVRGAINSVTVHY